MTNKKFVQIIIEEVYNDILKSNLKNFYETDIKETKGIFNDSKKIFDKLDDYEKKVFLNMLQSQVDDTIAVMLSIVDEWGGGYFDDGKDNDGHFELFYVSDDDGKYKFRVDEDTKDLFLEQMELQEEKNETK